MIELTCSHLVSHPPLPHPPFCHPFYHTLPFVTPSFCSFTALCSMHPMRALFLIPRNPPPKLKQPKKWLVNVSHCPFHLMPLFEWLVLCTGHLVLSASWRTVSLKTQPRDPLQMNFSRYILLCVHCGSVRGVCVKGVEGVDFATPPASI